MRRAPVSLAARSALIFARPGQSSCLSMTQVGNATTMRKITAVGIWTVVVRG